MSFGLWRINEMSQLSLSFTQIIFAFATMLAKEFSQVMILATECNIPRHPIICTLILRYFTLYSPENNPIPDFCHAFFKDHIRLFPGACSPVPTRQITLAR